MAIKIFIDQGHNPTGDNQGAFGYGITEQDVTFEVGQYLYDLLNQNRNFLPRLSRNSKTESLGFTANESLRQRVDMANSWGADYFISLHTNGSTIADANGTEGYVYSIDSAAYTLAINIVNEISDIMGTVNRGVFANPTLYVLRNTNMPSTLIEMAFITNQSNAKKLESDPYGFARAIYQGILIFFGMN